MAEKHFMKCSTPLVIWEFQIKTTMRFYLTLVRMAKIKKKMGQQMLAKMWRKRNTLPLLVELEAGATTLETSLVVHQKIEDSTT